MTDDMRGFHDILSHTRPYQQGYKSGLSQNWKQGRTAYGGLTLALAYDAAVQALNPLPPLRSLQINFVGPVTDDPVFTAKLLRQGRNVTTAQVMGYIETTDGDAKAAPKNIASANFIFGAARSSGISVSLPAPDAPPPEGCEPFTPEFVKRAVPQFFHNFDTRLIEGARPMSGAKEGYIRTWSRHHDAASRNGIASLLCISDVLPPAALPMFTKMGPVSSVNFTLNILVDEPQTDDGWWHIETRLSAAQGGYSSQIMRIWNMDGVLVAEGMQCVAIFM